MKNYIIPEDLLTNVRNIMYNSEVPKGVTGGQFMIILQKLFDLQELKAQEVQVEEIPSNPT